MFKSYRLRDYNFKLIIMIFALVSIGIMAIGSAEPSLQNKQLAGAITGALIMIILSFFNYSFLLKLYWPLYIVNLALLLLVIFSSAGDTGGGAQRWLEIGGLRFQPSETAKILLILFFAQFIMKYKEKLNTFPVIASCVVLGVVPWFLIFKQPDLSTSIVFFMVFCIILFSAGISYKLVFTALAVAIPAA